MKKTIMMSIVAAMALQLSTACTDYLYDGTVDLTIVEKPFEYPETYVFDHPCALVTQDDIDRVKSHVEAADGTDPVYASYLHLCQNTYAQIPYTPNPQKILVRGDANGTGVERENYINACRDAAAAFQLALRWRISGEAQFADAAVNVLNQWADVCERITANDNNQFLLAGFQGYQFANAAELLRDYDGWAAADQADFKQWLLDVWYAKNFWFIDNHGGSNVCALHYWPNWELANLASILAIGIYTDNVEMVNFVYKNFREGEGSGAVNHMIPFAPVPDPDIEGCMIAQNMESGRDQGHATLVVAVCAELCQMAWNIGLDFWGMEENKVLAMAEYTAKWNCKPEGQFIATTMPFTEFLYCGGEAGDCGCNGGRYHDHGAVHTEVTNDSGRGTVRPGWDLIYNHYAKVKGVGENACHYTSLFAGQLRMKDGVLTGDGGAGDSRYGTTSAAFDQVGWGTMLYTR